MNRSAVRNALALAVAAMGVIDLASAILSHTPDRLMALRRLVPTDVLDTSRTFTLIAGVLLLVTANGLARGKRLAFVAAMFLCAVSVPVNLLKAFDFEEATLATGLMFLLGVNGGAFTVKSRAPSWRALRSPAILLVLLLATYSVVGCWLIERRFGPGQASLRLAGAEAAYKLFGIGDAVDDVPRRDPIVRWFLGSISVMSVTLIGGLAIAALRPARHQGRHRAEAARVAGLVRQYGDSSVAAFAADPESDWFFSPNGRAVIAYRYESDVLLVIGDPIGPPEEIPSLLEAFERFCRDHDWRFAFYQARPERLAEYRARGWRAVHIGEDPIVNPATFTLEGGALANVRRNVHKIAKLPIDVRHFVPGVSPFDAARDPDGLLDELRAVSARWLAGRAGGEKGFCMGRFDPHRLGDVWLTVAWNRDARRVEGFCTWVPIPARRGWSLDLMRRRDDAPPGLMDFLVVRCIEDARARGDAVMSLALSALAKVEGSPASGEHAADDPARAFLMERLARFYDFEGLFRWKRKFAPAFEDRYLVYPDPLALPAIAVALVRAQTPGGLLSFLRPA